MITLTEDKYRPQSLDKMISLISMLVEKSRGDDRQLNLTDKDYNSIVGGKVRRRIQTYRANVKSTVQIK